jgi:hypothetical protein
VTELVREATRDGQRIALLRCHDATDGSGWTVVEAEVTPLRSVSTVARGPYRFPTAPEAFRFVQEAMLTLQYLGCSVHEPTEEP